VSKTLGSRKAHQGEKHVTTAPMPSSVVCRGAAPKRPQAVGMALRGRLGTDRPAGRERYTVTFRSTTHKTGATPQVVDCISTDGGAQVGQQEAREARCVTLLSRGSTGGAGGGKARQAPGRHAGHTLAFMRYRHLYHADAHQALPWGACMPKGGLPRTPQTQAQAHSTPGP
jgi:hypothetical protein